MHDEYEVARAIQADRRRAAERRRRAGQRRRAGPGSVPPPPLRTRVVVVLLLLGLGLVVAVAGQGDRGAEEPARASSAAAVQEPAWAAPRRGIIATGQTGDPEVTMRLLEQFLASERRLTEGDGDAYRELLTDDAVVVVPGQVLDKEACAAAIDASGGWDEVALDDARLVHVDDDAAFVTYRFTGRRGESARYAALMTSLYTRRDGAWRLALHQQTPLPA
jgi:ketosteroid isomerase-like protein